MSAGTMPKTDPVSATEIDVEQYASETSYLDNSVVRSLSWSDVTVTVTDRETKLQKEILGAVSGHVQAGEMMALMGPSGCGKTTLLNVLAQRQASGGAKVSGAVLLNGQAPSESDFRKLSSYVECDDALIGSITVRETLYFAAQLSLSGSVSATERIRRIEGLLQAFGLTNQANTLIGTLVRKGISSGQKRRLSVASQLISAPKVLFLDEPTSGLDSVASFNVICYIRDVVKRNKLIVITSIHQPSTSTFKLFDKLILLSRGKVCFSGTVKDIKPYFDGIGFEMPSQINPAEFVLDLTNIDFEQNLGLAKERITQIQDAWSISSAAFEEKAKIGKSETAVSTPAEFMDDFKGRGHLALIRILLHRSWIKSRRDILVYGVRFIMYLGLAIMMGTVWLRLPVVESSMQPLANCIMFGSCFMSFMSVVYVPAFLEDRMVYIKDRANGLYGATSFMISNFLIGLPYLFLIVVVSSTLVYWLTNFRPDGEAFLIWIMWNYLNLVAAESLVVLMSCLAPNFVAALALTSFANGIFMACDGFMVPQPRLNVFYRYVFSYIDYQAYVFRGLVVNEFGYRSYLCDNDCQCMYKTVLKDQCMNEGAGVLGIYGYEIGDQSKWVGIVLGIVVGLRLMGWAAMRWRT